MKKNIQIRDIVAESGKKAQGFVKIGETAGGPIQFPVVIVNGHEDGPIICLTSGVHATEYPPIDAVLRTVQGLQPGKLRGAVIAVPVVNLRMFEARMGFVSPLDGLNLNKLSTGNKNGSISDILAAVLLEEVIGLAQYHIDFHGGDLGEMLTPFAACAMNGNPEHDRQGEALVRLYSPKLISLSTKDGQLPPFPDAISYVANQRGIVSLFGESGGNGTLEEADVQVHLNGVRNVMQYLKMIDGEPSPAPGPRVKGLYRSMLRATRAGLLRLKASVGDELKAGQEIAEICNVFGEVVERVHMTEDGLAGLVWGHKVVHTGDPILRYWVTEPA